MQKHKWEAYTQLEIFDLHIAKVVFPRFEEFWSVTEYTVYSHQGLKWQQLHVTTVLSVCGLTTDKV